jgi:hypothetical protein
LAIFQVEQSRPIRFRRFEGDVLKSVEQLIRQRISGHVPEEKIRRDVFVLAGIDFLASGGIQTAKKLGEKVEVRFHLKKIKKIMNSRFGNGLTLRIFV